jgi:hypothetical protein
MKWIALTVLALTMLVSAQPKCELSMFYSIGYTVHNPSDRHFLMSRWLTSNADKCSSKELTVLWNNLAQTAGAADSAELRHKIVYAYEKAVEREKK